MADYSYLLDPKSPLVFRPGRPFGSTGGADTLPFPLPSTVAGALRTAYAETEAADESFDYAGRKTELMKIAVRGPLAVRRSLDAGSLETLFPRPADALYIPADDHPDSIYCLQPAECDIGSGCDLPKGLQPVFLAADAPKNKPCSGPGFWFETVMNDWLLGNMPAEDLAKLGIETLPIDIRSHVVINPETYGAETGKLFQSAGLDFAPRRVKDSGWDRFDYALLASCSQNIPATCRRLGGENRLVSIAPADRWPSIPEALAAALSQAGALRLILATPAIFTGGWRPGWISEQTLEGSPPGLTALKLRLCACAVDRWQAVSGWDLVAGKPRAVRRMAPAGSVYWFKVLSGAERASTLWLQSISDHEQDRQDGFGLVLPGIWNQQSPES